jgi:hypothetical protein
VPAETLKVVNEEVNKQLEKGSKRGEYLKLSSEEKATIAKYACINGVANTVRHFKEKNLKATSVSDWKRMYEKELKIKKKLAIGGEEVVVPSLPEKRRGRPPLLGKKCDDMLKELIVSMRSRGVPVGTSVVIGVGKGIMLKNSKYLLSEFGGTISLNKEWAKSVLRRMGYTKRRANSKSKMLLENFMAIKEQYLLDIKAVVTMEDIPSALILNWDQTAMKIVPSCAWTMEKKGTKRVEIAASDDKRQITAVFACSLSGDFLPMQLIYQGTTPRCLPKGVPFPADWHITYTANHWSNTHTMVGYVNKVIIPYVTETRTRLKLNADHPALVLFDVFKGQCTEEVLQLLLGNNILYILVPANTTDKLQPLDLSVNKPAKDYMRQKFQDWYGTIICKQLEDNIEEVVDLRLSVMKPLCAHWCIDLFHYLVSKPDIMVNGFKAAGIVDILQDSIFSSL